MQNKIEIRQVLLKKRRNVSTTERQAAANKAAHLLADDAIFMNSQHIACYFAQENEFDCGPIMRAIWLAKKNCYLPVLSSAQAKLLEFALYQKSDSLHPNRYKILEPQKAEKFSAEQLDLVLMPLVGFDLQGNRLGMGSGYYDKTFQFMVDNKLKTPYLMGLAYEIQRCTDLPHDAWDVPLNGVLTEKKRYFFEL